MASSMKAAESGASSATAAPAAEETPKAAVPSEAQSLGPDIETAPETGASSATAAPAAKETPKVLESGAKAAPAAPAAKETPKAAVPSEAPESGASSATAAPAAEETPKAAVPSEAPESGAGAATAAPAAEETPKAAVPSEAPKSGANTAPAAEETPKAAVPSEAPTSGANTAIAAEETPKADEAEAKQRKVTKLQLHLPEWRASKSGAGQNRQWLGDGWDAWLVHSLGMLLLDFSHMNPSVSLDMALLGQVSYSSFLGRLGAQVLGGTVGHLILERLSGTLELPSLSGPHFSAAVPLRDACFDEAVSTFLLLSIILTNGALFGRKMWLLQNLLVIAVARFNMEVLNRAGAAMNPMMGTSFVTYALSRRKASYHGVVAHVLCYWLASFAGALVALVLVGLPVQLCSRCCLRKAKAA
eukprot:s1634_g18.t1